MRAGLPAGEAVVLAVDEVVEFVETAGLAGRAVETREAGFEGVASFGRTDQRVVESLFPKDRIGRGDVGGGVGKRRRCDFAQEVRVSFGAQRETGVFVKEREFAVLVNEAKFTLFEEDPVVLGQERGEDARATGVGAVVPMDVEEGRVGGVQPVFEDVAPPTVKRPVDAHVVGDEVEEEAHAVGAQAFG